MKKQILVLLSGVLAALTLSACGGSSATCATMCTAMNDCAVKLGMSPIDILECSASCTTDPTCTNKQGMINCVQGASCADAESYRSAIDQCENTYCPSGN